MAIAGAGGKAADAHAPCFGGFATAVAALFVRDVRSSMTSFTPVGLRLCLRFDYQYTFNPNWMSREGSAPLILPKRGSPTIVFGA